MTVSLMMNGQSLQTEYRKASNCISDNKQFAKNQSFFRNNVQVECVDQ